MSGTRPTAGSDGVIPKPPTTPRVEVSAFATATTKAAAQESAVKTVPEATADLTDLKTRPNFPDELKAAPAKPSTHLPGVPSLPVTHMPTAADAVAFEERMEILLTEARIAARGHPSTPPGDVGAFVTFLRQGTSKTETVA